jgi:Tol biopolymer transport system component
MLPSTSPARGRRRAPRARARHRLLAVFAVTMAGAALAPAAALADSRIAFTNFIDDGTQKILTVGADGTGLTEVSSSLTGFDTDPTWSPDGDRLAFTRRVDNDGNGQMDSNEIFIVDADGGNLTQLTHNGIHEMYPDWSPDGRKIAFTRSDNGNISFVTIADGRETEVTRDDAFDYNPDWSPDGTKIAFDRYVDDHYGAHVANVDGTGVTNMTDSDLVNDEGPVWSPDGSRLAVTSYGNGPGTDRDEEVALIDVATKARIVLTANTTSDSEPTWSPGGGEIAYRAGSQCGADPACDSNSEIYVLRTDGAGAPRNVSHTVGTSDSRPAWGPSTAPADRDADGIPDALDTSADTASAAFSDGGTSGSIVDAAGLAVTLADLAAPDGVRVTVGAGTGQVTLRVCGFTVRLTAGSVADITCGSVRVAVAQGEAQIVTGDGLSVVTVPAGATARVSNEAGGSLVQNLGGAVTVLVDGVSNAVAVGAPVTVTPSAARLCRATIDAVRASAKYQALSRPARAGADRQVDALCTKLGTSVAKLRPAQKAALVAAYKQGLSSLVAAGWLADTQAGVLRAAADAL